MRRTVTIAVITFTILNATAQQTQTSKDINYANQKIHEVNITISDVNNASQNTQSTINNTKQLFVGASNFFKGNRENKKEEIKASDEKVVASTMKVNPSSSITSSPTDLNQTIIKISGCDFSKMKNISQLLKENISVIEISSSMDAPVATLFIKHHGTTEDLVDFLLNKPNNKLDVQAFSNGSVQFNLK